MKLEDTRRFPQRRNGVKHDTYGIGVVTMGRYSISDGDSVQVKFDNHPEQIIVKCYELTSFPSRGESPDPAVSRNSGWVCGNSYKSRKCER